ncbi:tRNA preQ1(34) S-adenosylmethionine ribosyltransferase-isomerase QueA [soil metagenome]
MSRLSDYDYFLPDELIAQTPLAVRDESRLLVLDRRSGGVRHGAFVDVLEILKPGDLLILNDTRVSGVRLFGHRPTGGSVELLLLEEVAVGRFRAMAKPAKKLPPGEVISFEDLPSAVVIEDLGDGQKLVEFSDSVGLVEKLDAFGTVPLPPYIYETLGDRERYQTVYGANRGSAAAPTAGLHFTSQILDQLRSIGVGVEFVTLHVGIDTFRPVMVDDLREHKMHGERCSISPKTADAVSRCGGRIIAVGTTTVRTLESFAMGRRLVKSGEMSTQIFIQPGFEFQIIDGMFTNFHLPKTTMLMMISALASREMVLDAYKSAIQERYRFLSFGDSMLII